MGYAHGVKWDEAKIKNAIKEVMSKAKIDTMPTHSLMEKVTGSKALSCAISKHGGTKYWANVLGLDVKACESKMGYEYECECVSYLTSFGYECEFTKVRYPYDILADGCIKIDVKSSKLNCYTQGNYYSFNLGKELPTCDVFVCYCLDESKIQKVYVIPACVLSGKCQLSIGEIKSRYDKYLDAWGVFEKYKTFYQMLMND